MTDIVELIVNTYTAHKKFMNGLACRGIDPHVAIKSLSENPCM